MHLYILKREASAKLHSLDLNIYSENEVTTVSDNINNSDREEIGSEIMAHRTLYNGVYAVQ